MEIKIYNNDKLTDETPHLECVLELLIFCIDTKILPNTKN